MEEWRQAQLVFGDTVYHCPPHLHYHPNLVNVNMYLTKVNNLMWRYVYNLNMDVYVQPHTEVRVQPQHGGRHNVHNTCIYTQTRKRKNGGQPILNTAM